MKTYWGSGGIATSILNFGTRWCESSASHEKKNLPQSEIEPLLPSQ